MKLLEVAFVPTLTALLVAPPAVRRRVQVFVADPPREEKKVVLEKDPEFQDDPFRDQSRIMRDEIPEEAILYEKSDISNAEKARIMNTESVFFAKERLSEWGSKWEKAFRGALNGNGSAVSEMAVEMAHWETPLRSEKSTPNALQSLAEIGSFFIKPKFDVLQADECTTTLKWRLSATWPIFWRPRINVYGETRMTMQDDKVVAFSETWHQGVFEIVLKQVLPQFWDIYDLYATPSAEQTMMIPGKKIKAGPFGEKKKMKQFQVVTQLPIPVKRVSLVDLTNKRSHRIASCLPDFAFTKTKVGSIAISDITATSPVLVSVTLLDREKDETPKRRIDFDIPIPSDLSSLPQLNNANITSGLKDQGWIGDCFAEYLDVPERHFLVTPFDGDIQDEDVEPLRKELVQAAHDAGLVLKESRPQPILIRKTAKAGFTRKGGHLMVAAYLPRPSWIPLDRSELAVEIEHP